MATSLALSRQHVIDLLKVVPGQFTASSAATHTLIDDMLVREFKHLWAKIPPIFRDAFTVASDNTITITVDLAQVLGIATKRHLLLPEVEWSETLDGAFIPNVNDAAPSDSLLVWYTTVPVFVYSGGVGPTTSIESTCVLGPDWLEEVAEYGAMLRVLVRTARDAASGGTDRDATMYRVYEGTYNQMIAELTASRERFLNRMDGRMGARVNLGKTVFRESDLPGTENRSVLISRETGFRTGGE